MRYTTNTDNRNERFSPAGRPPLRELPKDLADKLTDRDRIVTQRAEAFTKLADLNNVSLMVQAEATDAEVAAKAARAGKLVPAPKAVRQLQESRDAATHALAAQDAALAEITNELDNLASDHYWAKVDGIDSDLAAARESIRTQANALADAVESAIGAIAAVDWMRTGTYDRSAQTWPTEITNLDRYGLTNKNTTPIHVRDVIVAAATTALTPKEN